MKFQSEFKHFHSRKCTWTCRLRNGAHFVSASMCQCTANGVNNLVSEHQGCFHDDVIKWKHFPRYLPDVCGEFTGNSSHKSHWGEALMFSLICSWLNGHVNNWDAGDLRRHCAHYDIPVMWAIGLWIFRKTQTVDKGPSDGMILCDLTNYWQRLE